MASLKVTSNVSPASSWPVRVPVTAPAWGAIDTTTGPAPSDGEVAANDDWLPAASRMPLALAASATVNDPTAVLAAAPPSFSVRVAWLPDTLTDASVPPEGTFASVQGAFPAV